MPGLTGPHTPEAPVEQRGDAATIEQAKERLVSALRTWAAWAGVRRDGADAPRWVANRMERQRHPGTARISPRKLPTA